MHKILALAGLVLAAFSYQMLATDSLADTDGQTAGYEAEIVTRNAAISAFTQAKRLVEDAAGPESFEGAGTLLEGAYDGASYVAKITSDGEFVTIHSRSSLPHGADTVRFSVSAVVEWESFAAGPDGTSGRYLVLRAYREE